MWIKLNDSLINLDAYSEIFTDNSVFIDNKSGVAVYSYIIKAYPYDRKSCPFGEIIATYKNKQDRDRDFNTIISTLNIETSINEEK